MLLFNHPIRGIIPVINRAQIKTNDDDHYEALVKRQESLIKKYNSLKNYNSIPIGSTVAV